jgi:hypothetical protein
MHEESVDKTVEKIEFRDQYLGVLLEFYLVREETLGQGPLGRAKLKYWTRIVRIFEEGFPPELLRRVRYRVRRAEKLGFQSIQLAMVRYSWAVALSGWETPQEARDRWIRYLAEPENDGTVVSFESFEARRRFRMMLVQVERSGLWPAPARLVHQGGI